MTFLAQKFHAATLLLATQTKEEYFGIIQQLLQSKNPLEQDSTYFENSELISLQNLQSNEDDCFGILSKIKYTKNNQL